MNINRSNSLPMFLHYGEICIYVVDSDLLGYRTIVGVYDTPHKPYNNLLELYNIPNIRIIPEELNEFFAIKKPLELTLVDDCIIGTNGYYAAGLGLDAKMSIDTEANIPQVIFYDFKYYMRYNRAINYNYRIELGVDDTFYTLANICANGRATQFWKQATLDLETLTEDALLNSHYIRKLEAMPENELACEQFILAYIDYIINQLSERKIQPYNFLQKSGAFVLSLLADLDPVSDFIFWIFKQIENHEKLSTNDKAIFHTFLKLIHRVKIAPNVYEFLEDNDATIKQIEKELSLDFPT